MEGAHKLALNAALDGVRAILEKSGDAGTPATLTAVAETLDALPGPEPPGRLTRPLKPRGFDALAGLLMAARRAQESRGRSAVRPEIGGRRTRA